jgi:ATP-dependent RNA helicase DeaD
MNSEELSFNTLGLSEAVLQAVTDVGYEKPSPIQAAIIPHVLSGKDVIGQAQTGTGKTAAFAMPLLSKLDMHQKLPQVLVLTPTRELAIQVAEAFQKYGNHIEDFHVLPIYGGQSFEPQLKSLKRGVQVVVGTPGRVMDHIRRGTLKLDNLKCLVLDEADEMLRMGFIEDVEWILDQAPEERQIALFSATMPPQIRRIAEKYLNDPEQITIKVKTATASTIRQRFWGVSGLHKLDALTRILETEVYDGIIIFVRTKTSTTALADKMEARGFRAAALNGDIPQVRREKIVDNFKSGRLDILIATDVAARGLDVDRVSHVINYDIPQDTESYIHRIGRTGRAGRSGEAILFVSPREQHQLRQIERATKQKIERLEMPTSDTINDFRIARFKQRISEILNTEDEDLALFRDIIEQYRIEFDTPSLDIAAALAKQLQGDTPLLLKKDPERKVRDMNKDFAERNREPGYKKGERTKGDIPAPVDGMELFHISVGHDHKVKPGNIVGAIANEAGLESQYIGEIKIFGRYSILNLPVGMPKELLNDLKTVEICGQKINIRRYTDEPPARRGGGDRGGRGRRGGEGRGDRRGGPRRGGDRGPRGKRSDRKRK